MALSDLAKQIILQELSNKSGFKKDKVEYTVETGLKDPTRDGRVAKLSFKFSKPVSLDYLEGVTPKIFELISTNYDIEQEMESLAFAFARILGIGSMKRIGKKRTIGSVNVSLGDPAEDDPDAASGVIRGQSGMFVSNSNMMSMLEILSKMYLTQDMKKANAPLKWRTGRFANSLEVKSLLIKTEGREVQAIISYNYMTRPYSVFNPAISTYRKLSLRPFAGARNPQKLIGEALAKAARDLIHSKYKIKVQEGTL